MLSVKIPFQGTFGNNRSDTYENVVQGIIISIDIFLQVNFVLEVTMDEVSNNTDQRGPVVWFFVGVPHIFYGCPLFRVQVFRLTPSLSCH